MIVFLVDFLSLSDGLNTTFNNILKQFALMAKTSFIFLFSPPYLNVYETRADIQLFQMSVTLIKFVYSVIKTSVHRVLSFPLLLHQLKQFNR